MNPIAKRVVYLTLLIVSYCLAFLAEGIAQSPVVLSIAGSLVFLFSVTRVLKGDFWLLYIGLVLYGVFISYLVWDQHVVMLMGLVFAITLPLPLSLLVSQVDAVTGEFITYGIGFVFMETIQGIVLGLSFVFVLAVTVAMLCVLFFVLKIMLSDKGIVKLVDLYGQET